MLFEAPEIVKNIKEIKSIYEKTDKIGAALERSQTGLEGDIYLSSASEEKIKKFEKILGIKKNDLDTLDERRFRVKNKVYQRLPYTYRILKEKLNALCGENEYTLDINIGKETILCTIELKMKTMHRDVLEMIEEIAPLNMIIEVQIRYNQYKTFSRCTYEQLSFYNHAQMREEVMPCRKQAN